MVVCCKSCRPEAIVWDKTLKNFITAKEIKKKVMFLPMYSPWATAHVLGLKNDVLWLEGFGNTMTYCILSHSCNNVGSIISTTFDI